MMRELFICRQWFQATQKRSNPGRRKAQLLIFLYSKQNSQGYSTFRARRTRIQNLENLQDLENQDTGYRTFRTQRTRIQDTEPSGPGELGYRIQNLQALKNQDTGYKTFITLEKQDTGYRTFRTQRYRMHNLEYKDTEPSGPAELGYGNKNFRTQSTKIQNLHNLEK